MGAVNISFNELWDRLRGMGKAARYVWLYAQIQFIVRSQIKAMRIQRGWSQKVLANKAGVHWTTIYRIEHSPWVCPPRISVLQRVAAAFDVALLVRFVRWSEFVKTVLGVEQINAGLSSSSLCPKSFSEEEAELNIGGAPAGAGSEK